MIGERGEEVGCVDDVDFLCIVAKVTKSSFKVDR